MSGNYDYPPASNRGSRGSRSGGNRLQHLRDLLNSERNRDTSARALETLNQEIDEYRSGRVRDRSSFEQARSAVDRQIQRHRSAPWNSRPNPNLSHNHDPHPNHAHIELQRVHPGDISVVNTEDTLRPLSGLGPRRNAIPPRPPRQLREYFGLGPLLDEDVPRLEIPPIMPQDRDSDRPMDRSRPKRRKLETDDHREGFQSFRYGQYGQVVPGALRMELASCDGGTYEPEGECSWPQNVLRNDPSVYCTKSDRCNLILKHRGDAPFCLKKIVIKAPKCGYDAPIQEGMVFVSMACDDLLARTAAYQVEYPTPRRHRRHRRNGLLPSQEYLNAFRSPLHPLERSAITQDSRTNTETDNDPFGGRAGDAPNPMAEFQVTTEYDDQLERSGFDSLGLGGGNPSIVDLAAWQMEQLNDDLLDSDSDDSESDDDSNSEQLRLYNNQRRELQRQMRAMRRAYAPGGDPVPQRPAIDDMQGATDELRRLDSANQVSTGQPSTSRASATQTNHDTRLLKPHARFFIERAKSMVSIKFDPPPSGRFILIKLWSPHTGGNIDIQSIIAHGYAGPRFFPAGNFR